MMLPTHNRMGAPYPRVRLDTAPTDVPAAPQANLKDSKGGTNVGANANSDADADAEHQRGPTPRDSAADSVAHAARLALSAQAHAARFKSLADNAFTDKLRDLCFDASRTIGAVEWVRYGYELSTKLPCAVINPEVGEQEHYQVDLVLVPPSHHHFTVYYTSFGYALMLLAVGVRRISRSLTLHMTHLSLRHSPFFGLPYVDVELTKDAREFADWLGLDYARWFEGFANERELWEWMTDVSEGNKTGAGAGAEADAEVKSDEAHEGVTDERLERWMKQDPRTRKSPLAGAWRALAKSRKKEPTPHKAKMEGLDRFCAWLRMTRWAEPRTGEGSPLEDPPTLDPSASQSKVDGEGDLVTAKVIFNGVSHSEDPTQTQTASVEPRTPTSSTFHATPPVPFLSPSQSSTTGTITSLDPETSNPSNVSNGSNPSAVDPENPTPLDFRAIKTLRFWGKSAAYEAAVEERRGKARELAESQQRRERGAGASIGGGWSWGSWAQQIAGAKDGVEYGELGHAKAGTEQETQGEVIIVQG